MLVHVAIGLAHSTSEMLAHLATFTPLTFLISRPAVSEFFQRSRAVSA
jgi:hypothetical protein